VVIGKGKRINKLKQLSASSGLDIIFEETRDRARISELLRQSWVNINFFNKDGKGYSILDASASGTPTIAYKILNVSELVKDNCNGFLVNHLYEFKERIMYTIINEEHLSKCSREMAQGLNWDIIADSWNEVINKI
jgi:glycosyltransferase involved in cell wall biosynthesis